MAPTSEGRPASAGGPRPSAAGVLVAAQPTAPPVPPATGDPCPALGPDAVAVAPDADGDGCPESVTIRTGTGTGTVTVGGHAYGIDLAVADRVLIGDWDCDGIATLAVVHLPSGAVDLFDRWPAADATVPRRGHPHRRGRRRRVRRGRAGRDGRRAGSPCGRPPARSWSADPAPDPERVLVGYRRLTARHGPDGDPTARRPSAQPGRDLVGHRADPPASARTWSPCRSSSPTSASTSSAVNASTGTPSRVRRASCTPSMRRVSASSSSSPATGDVPVSMAAR